jgi:hypothetical protein
MQALISTNMFLILFRMFVKLSNSPATAAGG